MSKNTVLWLSWDRPGHGNGAPVRDWWRFRGFLPGLLEDPHLDRCSVKVTHHPFAHTHENNCQSQPPKNPKGFFVGHNVSKLQISKMLREACVFTALFPLIIGRFVVFLPETNISCASFQDDIQVNWETRSTCENTGSGYYSDAEPCVFTIVFTCMFSKPYVFAVVLGRFGFAMAQWIAALAADLLKMK